MKETRYEARRIVIYRIYDRYKQYWCWKGAPFLEYEDKQEALRVVDQMNRLEENLKKLPDWDGIGRPPRGTR